MATKKTVGVPNLTLTIPQRKQALMYAKSCAGKAQLNLAEFRQLLTFRDRAYMRQTNTTAKQLAAVRANMNGDLTQVQDVTVPIVMPQVETATAYQAGVFLTSYPIFGVTAKAADQDVATQFEVLLGQQSQYFGWARELIKTFRNGFKHNFGPAEVEWAKVPITGIASSQDVTNPTGVQLTGASYGGNRIKALDPYNCFVDPLVAPCNLHTDGEFFGYNELISRIQLKRWVTTLDPAKTTHLRDAYESSYSSGASSQGDAMSYFVPDVNRYYANLRKPSQDGVNWLAWLNMDTNLAQPRINYKDNYIKTTLFCRVCPSDFGGVGNIPVIYKLVIINWQYVVFAEQLIQAHDFLPTIVMQPNEDGLGYQTQSLLDNGVPFQDMASAMWNITLESQRRKVYDRILYNPQFIDKRHIDPANPTARIPVKNAGAMNFEPSKAIFKIPYDDPQATLGIQVSQQLAGMADEAAGQNRVARGQFQKGNKTQAEFETTMDGSNSRNQLAALCIEGQFMAPVKEIVKSNTLQHQQKDSILNSQTGTLQEIDPVKLRSTILRFGMTDGVLPTEKMLNTNVMQVFMQFAQGMPAVNAEYDIMGLFLYWCKLQGASWIGDFKRDEQGQAAFLKQMQNTTNATTPDVAPTNEAGMASAQAAQMQQAAAQQQAQQQVTAQG